MEWAEETIVRLRTLWDEGLSTAEIGRRLGVSKNAVVGKAHRLDLPARPSPVRRDGGSRRATRRSAPRLGAAPRLPPPFSTSRMVGVGRGAPLVPRLAPVVASEPPPVPATR